MLKGSKMKARRITEGFSQKELSFTTGIIQQKISRIERGMAPTTEEALNIVKALNTTIKQLFKKVRP